MTTEQRQYPIGKWTAKESYSVKEIEKNIAVIEKYPAKYKRLTKQLSDEDLAKTYREGSWTVREILVHLSDMHFLHYARFKQALSDQNPVGFAANINAWNVTPEVASTPTADALLLLEATHKRYVHLAKSMSGNDFDKTYFHPLRQMNLTLAQSLSISAWHTKHHFEHIKIALQ